MKRYEAEPVGRILIDKEKGEVIAQLKLSHVDNDLMLLSGVYFAPEKLSAIADWLAWMNEEVAELGGE